MKYKSSSKKWTKKFKAAFISIALGFVLAVSGALTAIGVYAKDNNGEFSVPVKAFVCSCGREGHETPLGTFKTSN